MRKGVVIGLLVIVFSIIIIGVIIGLLKNTNSDDVISKESNFSKSEAPTSISLSNRPNANASEVLCPFNKDAVDVTREDCISLGCAWIDPEATLHKAAPSPGCFFPSPFTHGYWIEIEEKVADGEVKLHLKLIETSLKIFPDMKERLEVHLIPYGEDMLRIKITDPSEERYEVPIPLNVPTTLSSTTSSRYVVSFRTTDGKANDIFAIQVRRKQSGTLLFDTSIGGFTFAKQFLQISTKLPSENLFGFGENSHYRFKHDLNYKTWPMFARDEGPKDGDYNLYGSHPVYYVMENDGNCHAVFWLNSAAMEAETLPTPGLTMRAIGGVMDLFFFLGPSPAQAVSQYTALIGRPFLPPYWALGFQLCRYGHPNLQDMEAVMLRTRRHGIPQDVQYADIDYMQNRLDFTLDKENFNGLPSLVKSKKEEGLRFIVILDPAINVEVGPTYETHQRAVRENVYIKWLNETLTPLHNFGMEDVMLGYVWPDNRTAFPDWFKSRTRDWWKEEIRLFYDTIQFDGLWIDMNEPANFGTNLPSPWNWPEGRPPWSLHCPSSAWDDPPYPTKASRMHGNNRLSDKTICMVGVQGENGEFLHYDVHNLYGWSQTFPTMQGLQKATGKRGIVVSRSTFPSTGKWAGHWLGDNNARWQDLRASITGMMEFNLFGIPYVGADICGFFGNTTEDLCRRWMQLGAFYPYARNHNSKGSKNQDPGMWPSVAASGREALRLRYSLLPFLYSLHYLASTKGETVVRPLFFEFPSDPSTWSIDDQFLWGSSLMITPVLNESKNWRTVYFPRNKWYAHPKGTLHAFETGRRINISVSERDEVPIYVRGGYIIPTQRPASNTKLSRRNPLGLIVAPDYSNQAEGMLFWDDGESIDTIKNMKFYVAKFSYNQNAIEWFVEKANETLTKNLRLSDVRVYDVNSRPKAILKDGKRVRNADWHYDTSEKVLQIYDLNLAVNVNFTLSWTDKYDYKLPCPIPYKDGWTEESSVTEEMCLPACIWNSSRSEVRDKPANLNPQTPCHLPSNSQFGYKIGGEKIPTEKGFQILLRKRNSHVLFGDDVINVRLEVFFYSSTMLRFKFTDSESERYEVPIPLTIPAENVPSVLYEVKLESEKLGDPFAIYIVRKETGTVLFDTRIGGLVYSNQFLSVSTYLASKNVYGLGENNHGSFKHTLNGTVWPIFARDQPPQSEGNQQLNLYGSHPFYQVQENDGKSHGVFLLNSNAIDYQFLDFPVLTFRTIGGVLDFFLFGGPSPEDVNKQYTSLIHRPVLPPYWALGFQICRYGYKNTNHIRQVLNRTSYYEIPQDVQYVDIEYMDRRKDFTIDEKNFGDLPQLFDEIKEYGMRTVIILDPAINAEMKPKEYESHSRAMGADVYIKWPSSTLSDTRVYNNPESDIILGYVWPDNKTAFPNWHKESTKVWWTNEILLFYKESLKFDGLWIDMNEPAVFDTNMDKPWNWPEGRSPWNLKCPQNQWDDPSYATKAASLGPSFRMSDKTLCLMSDETPFRHYDSHNLYGWSQTGPTLRALRKATNKRGLVISRSTFPGSGQWAGHWLGDNAATWEDLHRSIIGMLEFNIFGIPYVGADICGFFGDSNEELCQRWMQLGAFYPYARNHNGKGYKDQDPGIWPAVAKTSKKILNVRYSLLTYLYTLFYEANVYGGTVIRPLHHEFPLDRNSYNIDSQFLWGPALMVSPVIVEGQVSRQIYFPMDFWYDFYTGKPVEWPGERVLVEADLDTIPLHIRGGFVLPKQQPANNTKYSRRNPLELLVALNASRQAIGFLFWDDGEGIDTIQQKRFDLLSFVFDQDVFNITITKNVDLVSSLMLKKVTIYGIENKPNYILQNDSKLNQIIYVYDLLNLKLTLSLDLNVNKDLSFTFAGIWD